MFIFLLISECGYETTAPYVIKQLMVNLMALFNLV